MARNESGHDEKYGRFNLNEIRARAIISPFLCAIVQNVDAMKTAAS
jgi:hypothetical protein